MAATPYTIRLFMTPLLRHSKRASAVAKHAAVTSFLMSGGSFAGYAAPAKPGREQVQNRGYYIYVRPAAIVSRENTNPWQSKRLPSTSRQKFFLSRQAVSRVCQMYRGVYRALCRPSPFLFSDRSLSPALHSSAVHNGRRLGDPGMRNTRIQQQTPPDHGHPWWTRTILYVFVCNQRSISSITPMASSYSTALISIAIFRSTSVAAAFLQSFISGLRISIASSSS